MKLEMELGRDLSEYTHVMVEIPDDEYTELRKTGRLHQKLAELARRAVDGEDDAFFEFESDTSTAHSLRIVRTTVPGVARVTDVIRLEADFTTAGQMLNNAVLMAKANKTNQVLTSLTEAVQVLGVGESEDRAAQLVKELLGNAAEALHSPTPQC